MARPITWQNIQGPDPKGAMLPLVVASQTLNNAFSGLKDTVNEYQTGVKDQNTGMLLSALSRYQTPEAIQNAMASGELDQLKASLGPVHEDRVYTAMNDSLDNALRRTHASNTDFRATARHGMDMERGRLEIDDARDKSKADRLTDQLNQAVARGMSHLQSEHAAGNLTDAEVTEGVHQMVADLQSSLGISPDKVQAAIAAREPMLTFGSEGFGPDRITRALAKAQQEKEAADLAANNAAFDGSRNGLRNIEELNKFLGEAITDETERHKMGVQAGRMAVDGYTLPNGERIDYPLAVLKAAAASSADPSMWNFSRGDVFRNTRHLDMKHRADLIMQDPEMLRQVMERFKEDGRELSEDYVKRNIGPTSNKK